MRMLQMFLLAAAVAAGCYAETKYYRSQPFRIRNVEYRGGGWVKRTTVITADDGRRYVIDGEIDTPSEDVDVVIVRWKDINGVVQKRLRRAK